MIGGLVITRFVAGDEVLPKRIQSVGIVRINRFITFSGWTGKLDEFVAYGAMAAENALLHTEFLHLLKDRRGGADVRPQDDGIHARVLNDLQLTTKISIARHKLLLDHNGVPEAARCIFEFENSEATVAIVHSQQRNSFQTEFGVDVSRERITLQAIILNDGVIPGNDRLGNRRVC